MGMSENEIYPPAKHFHWEDDENIIGIGGTRYFQTNSHVFIFACFFPVVKSRNILERFWSCHIPNLEQGTSQLELRIELFNHMFSQLTPLYLGCRNSPCQADVSEITWSRHFTEQDTKTKQHHETMGVCFVR